MGYCTNSISEAICHGSTDLSTRLCGKSSSLWCYWNSIDWSLILSQQYHQNVGIMVQPQFKEEFLLTYYLSYRMRTFLGVIPHSYWLGWYAEAQCSVGQSSNFLMLTSRIYGLESLCVLHRKEEQKTTWSYLGYYLWTFLLVLFSISFVCVCVVLAEVWPELSSFPLLLHKVHLARTKWGGGKFSSFQSLHI